MSSTGPSASVPPSAPASAAGTSSAGSTGAAATPTLPQRLLRLAKHAQFAWYIGHVLTVVGLPMFLLFGARGAYFRALLGAMLAYGVVLYRQYAPTLRATGAQAAAQRMAGDLNVQYFMLAFFFWMSGWPCVSILVPYFSFSLFHVIGYSKDVLVPAVFPASAGTPPPAILATLFARAATFSATYQPAALQLASFWEITASPLHILLQVLTWRQALLAPVVYAQFMATRYATSATTRAAAAKVREELDKKLVPLAAREGVVGKIGQAYTRARDYIGAYLDRRTRAAGGAPAAGAGTVPRSAPASAAQ